MVGYEVDRFLNPPQELIGYLCGMCQKVLYKPTQCKHCITYYCLDCIKYKLCPNNCQKGKEDNSLYTINKYMKNKMNNTLRINCKYAEYGCTNSFYLKDLHTHEKNCTAQAFFCPNKGCYTRIPAFKLDAHLKKCNYEKIPCSTCGFEILRKENGVHDCVGRMQEHLHKTNAKNHEMTERLKQLQTQENELRNRLDQMTTDNNNITMRLSQQVEHLERENGSILHDISTIPTGQSTRTRQDEIDELNEFDNVTQKSVSKYIKRVDKKIADHTNEINEEFSRVQERLRDHFKLFANAVRDKFNQEVIQEGINQKYEKLSPIKQREHSDDDQLETGEDSRLTGINEEDDQFGNDECLSPELREVKNHLVRAYTSPLNEYQSAINTTADFRKSANLEKDLKYTDMTYRHHKNERSTSVEQKKKREDMKKRLDASKFKTGTVPNSAQPQDVVKSARLWNGFDTYDPYPDRKYTTNVTSPSVPQTLTPVSKAKTINLGKAQSVSVSKPNNIRKKKDELVKTLLYSNRNR